MKIINLKKQNFLTTYNLNNKIIQANFYFFLKNTQKNKITKNTKNSAIMQTHTTITKIKLLV